jgi:hypothetical protein
VIGFALGGAGGCDPTHLACEHVGQSQSAVVGGALSSPYVGLDYVDTVVPLVDDDGATVCTAFAVDAKTLLTAAHCFPRATAAVVQNETFALVIADDPPLRVDLEAVGLADAPMLRPLRVARDVASLIAPGSLVEVAGFGESDAGVGQAQYAVLSIAEITEQSLVTDAQGYGGACLGDSGSPLLTRDSDGNAVALGILTAGSSTCRGMDESLRADVSGALVLDSLDLGDVAAGDCGTLPNTGRCFDQRAVWCDSDTLHAEACGDGRVCGWDSEAVGFRCVQSKDDPCAGISDLGTCEDGEARQCLQGTLVDSPCSECNAECVRSPRSGISACTPR